jgi:hypothetical protein
MFFSPRDVASWGPILPQKNTTCTFHNPRPFLFLLCAKLQKFLPKQNKTLGIIDMDDLVIIHVGYES